MTAQSSKRGVGERLRTTLDPRVIGRLHPKPNNIGAREESRLATLSELTCGGNRAILGHMDTNVRR
jgi:hypothetical protein